MRARAHTHTNYAQIICQLHIDLRYDIDVTARLRCWLAFREPEVWHSAMNVQQGLKRDPGLSM